MPDHPTLPIRISGSFFEGIALCPHLVKQTTHSGKSITRRSALAETMYRYRYQGDGSMLHPIASCFARAVQTLFASSQTTFHGLVLVPPPIGRVDYTPVVALATEISRLIKIPSLQFAVRDIQGIGNEPPRKSDRTFNFSSPDAKAVFTGKQVLAIDDIYRSGRSLNRFCSLLKKEGEAAGITAIVGTLVTTG